MSAAGSSHPWLFRHEDPSIRITAADNTTDPNATFQQESVGTTANNVDMVICCLSLVGSLFIILPYVLNRRSRKLRHALILGLATSDLATSIMIIITTACLIANINLVEHAGPCTFLGYILVSSIFSQHLWNLSIAIVTYMILVHPLSSFTLTVEKRVRWLWPIFWIIAFAINAIPFGLGGFGFRGGYCSFTTSFYFASIFQFVPRALVVCVIVCLYTHLFFFLRRTNLFSKANTSNSISQSRHSRGRSETQPQINSKPRLSIVPQHVQSEHGADQPLMVTMPSFNDMLTAPGDDGSTTTQRKGSSEPSTATAHSRKTSVGSRITPVLNKNDPNNPRRRSSSVVDKDGSVEMATLRKDSSTDASLSGLLSYSMQKREDSSPASTTAPLATYGMLDPNYSMAPRKPMPSGLDIEKANSPSYDSASISPESPSTSSGVGGGAATLSAKGSSAPLNGSFPRGSGESDATARRVNAAPSSKRPFTAGETSANQISAKSPLDRRASLGDPRYHSPTLDSDDSDNDSSAGRMRPRKDVADFDMITPPVEHLKHYNHSHHFHTAPIRNFARMADILAMGEDEMERARRGNVGTERRGSAVQILPGEVVVEMPSKEAFEQSLGDDWKWGMDVTTGPQPDLPSSKQHRSRHANISLSRDETGLATGTSSTSSADENGVDAIGSTLNRQASLLLLLYPAAYCLLFSISMARLCVDLADPGSSIRHAHDWLHSLSRWLIFAQGAIDALIFQFVERQFRQRMKRRRRKAMGEKVEDSLTFRMGKKVARGMKRGWTGTSRGSQSMGTEK